MALDPIPLPRRRRGPWRHVVAVASIAVAALAADRMGWTDGLDRALGDRRSALVTYQPSGDIVLVDIDARSLGEIGIWPWPRSLHAELVREADRLGARTLAFDVDFSSASNPADDAEFARALGETSVETFLAAFVQEASVGSHEVAASLPIEELLQVSWPAGVNVPLDGDGRVRRFTARVEAGSETIASMPVLLGGTEPVGEIFGLDLSLDAAGLSRISYVDLLRGRVDPRLVEGRTLIVGATALELRDLFRVPLHGLISGSTIIALAAETLMAGRATSAVEMPAIAYALVVLLGFLAVVRMRSWRALCVLAVAAVSAEILATLSHHGAHASFGTGGLQFALLGFAGWAVLREFDLRKLLLKVSMAEASNSRLMLERVVEDGFDGIVILDGAGAVLRSNEAARSLPLLGGLPGVPRQLGQFPPAVRAAVERVRSRGAEPSRKTHDVEVRTPGGERTLEYTVAPLRLRAVDPDASAPLRAHICLTFRDVTQARHAQERMRFMALHDSLTGLGNRRALEKNLEALVSQSAPLALVTFDLDRFKSVNDTLGHGIGDCVLVETARRATQALGPNAVVSRIGGDEFAAILPTGEGPDLIVAARELAAAIDAPFFIEGHRISVGTSIGVAMHRKGVLVASRLMQQADMALYRAKHSAGTPRVALFHPDMEEQRLARLEIETELTTAIEEGQFEVVYQPQVCLKDGALVGAEALLRWNHPTRGSVSPTIFIPIAEETGLIHRLGEWVMREACREAALWAQPIRIAVNVSSLQFEVGDLVEVVERTLEETSLAPERLELEITESAFVRESPALDRIFEQLSARGIGFALDDFGTGYSSLGYLHRFPISKIKIDKSFVDGLPDDGQSMAIVRSVLALAGGLGLRTIAEGIETPEQAECLRLLGCREAQGYLFHRPIDAREMRALATPAASNPAARTAKRKTASAL